MKPSVFVTRKIPEEGLEIVRANCNMEINPENRVLTKEEIIKGVRGKDGLLCLLTDTIDKDVMDASPSLRVISNYAVGYNNIDVEEATRRNIMVCNTPGVLTETTADLCWALLMASARRIVEGDKFVREGKFVGWDPMLLLGQDVYNKTLGIIGFGRIGQAVAKRSIGFDMRVIYYDIQRASEEIEKKYNAKFTQLDDLLKEADFITIHTPLSKETYHLIGEREFNLMKKTSILINTARGPIVDEKALVKALKENKIAGAALDVYEREPELEEGLKELDNVVIIPHLGSASYETRTKMAIMAAENLVAGLSGKIPQNLVNKEVIKNIGGVPHEKE